MRRGGITVACNWGDEAAHLPVTAAPVAMSSAAPAWTETGVLLPADAVLVTRV
jgi:hypothetical protein